MLQTEHQSVFDMFERIPSVRDTEALQQAISLCEQSHTLSMSPILHTKVPGMGSALIHCPSLFLTCAATVPPALQVRACQANCNARQQAHTLDKMHRGVCVPMVSQLPHCYQAVFLNNILDECTSAVHLQTTLLHCYCKFVHEMSPHDTGQQQKTCSPLNEIILEMVQQSAQTVIVSGIRPLKHLEKDGNIGRIVS